MKEDLLDILCCPMCKGTLELETTKQDDATGEILEGTLRCAACPHDYPIEDGIPNLLPPEDATEA